MSRRIDSERIKTPILETTQSCCGPGGSVIISVLGFCRRSKRLIRRSFDGVNTLHEEAVPLRRAKPPLSPELLYDEMAGSVIALNGFQSAIIVETLPSRYPIRKSENS